VSPSPSARARREAIRWYGQARQQAKRQLEEEDVWDEQGLQRVGRETRRREAMASLPQLRQAIRLAEQAMRLATTADERYAAALLLTQWTCDAGEQRRELAYARIVISLRPHQLDSLKVLKRAADCNHLTALAKKTDDEIEHLPEPPPTAEYQLGGRNQRGRPLPTRRTAAR
jgi:hypothetical protein